MFICHQAVKMEKDIVEKPEDFILHVFEYPIICSNLLVYNEYTYISDFHESMLSVDYAI